MITTLKGTRFAVVLGGGMAVDGVCGEATILRAQAGIRLAQQDPDLTIILSGGAPDGCPTNEALEMQKLFLQAGIAPERLVLEEESRCTLGNAVIVWARFLGGVQFPAEGAELELHIVTSPFHMARARHFFGLVFGPQWKLVDFACDKAADDDARAVTEPLGIQWADRLMAGVQPGHFAEMAARFSKERPYYAGIGWLQELILTARTLSKRVNRSWQAA